jgi:hypothetical protein
MVAAQAHASCCLSSDHWRLAEVGANMLKASSLIVLLALAACSGLPQREYAASPCSINPGGYECQIERYMTAP